MPETVEEKAGRIQTTIMQMGLLTGCLSDLDLDLVLNEGMRVESLGPLLDPTAYMRNSKARDQNLRLARIFRKAREQIKEELGPEVLAVLTGKSKG